MKMIGHSTKPEEGEACQDDSLETENGRMV